MSFITRIGRWVVGLGILAWLIYAMKPAALVQNLQRIDLLFVPLWLCAYFVSQALGALNIHLLLRPFTNVRYVTLLRYDLVATSLGYFTPAQIGMPVSLALNLKQDGVRLSRSASALLIDKFTTFWVALALAFVGAAHALKATNAEITVGAFFQSTSVLIGIAAVLIVASIIIVLWFRNQRLKAITKDLLEALSSYRQQKKYLISNLLVTVVVQCSFAFLWMITFLTVGRAVDFGAMITTIPAISLVAQIPVTIAGIGTQELSAVYLWKSAGVSADLGLSVYLVSRSLTILTSVGVLLVGKGAWTNLVRRTPADVNLKEKKDKEL